MRYIQCSGEGQGSCTRCNENGKWNRHWMWGLYTIEGMDGIYCSDCVKDICGPDVFNKTNGGTQNDNL